MFNSAFVDLSVPEFNKLTDDPVNVVSHVFFALLQISINSNSALVSVPDPGVHQAQHTIEQVEVLD